LHIGESFVGQGGGDSYGSKKEI